MPEQQRLFERFIAEARNQLNRWLPRQVPGFQTEQIR